MIKLEILFCYSAYGYDLSTIKQPSDRVYDVPPDVSLPQGKYDYSVETIDVACHQKIQVDLFNIWNASYLGAKLIESRSDIERCNEGLG